MNNINEVEIACKELEKNNFIRIVDIKGQSSGENYQTGFNRNIFFWNNEINSLFVIDVYNGNKINTMNLYSSKKKEFIKNLPKEDFNELYKINNNFQWGGIEFRKITDLNNLFKFIEKAKEKDIFNKDFSDNIEEIERAIFRNLPMQPVSISRYGMQLEPKAEKKFKYEFVSVLERIPFEIREIIKFNEFKFVKENQLEKLKYISNPFVPVEEIILEKNCTYYGKIEEIIEIGVKYYEKKGKNQRIVEEVINFNETPIDGFLGLTIKLEGLANYINVFNNFKDTKGSDSSKLEEYETLKNKLNKFKRNKTYFYIEEKENTFRESFNMLESKKFINPNNIVVSLIPINIAEKLNIDSIESYVKIEDLLKEIKESDIERYDIKNINNYVKMKDQKSDNVFLLKENKEIKINLNF